MRGRWTRSAKRPAIGPTRNTGNRSAKAMTPIQALEPVSVQANQPMATRWVQLPISEIELPLT